MCIEKCLSNKNKYDLYLYYLFFFSVASSSTLNYNESDNKIINFTNNKNEIFKCDSCNIEMNEFNHRYHARTNIHKANCLMKSEFENIHIIGTAFKNRIRSYRVNPREQCQYHAPESFLYEQQSNIIKLIEMSLKKHTCIKVNFELFANFVLPKTEQELSRELKSFTIKYDIIYNSTDLVEFYSNITDNFCEKLSEFEHCQSGWSFESISHLEININKYTPLRGGSYIDLPTCIKNTKSCINIRSNDERCFLWSIVAALHPCKVNVNRTSSYPHYSSVLNSQGMNFPPTPNDLKVFEKNNPNISLNIYGLDDKMHITGPLYCSKDRKQHNVNLLYFEKCNKQHYCLIKDLVRLVRRQVTLHKGKMYLCEACLQFFVSNEKYKSHNCSLVLTEMPSKNILQFEHYERQQKINFVIYADFESLLVNCQEVRNTQTQAYKVHKASCFAYYICCSHNPSLNKFRTYRGHDCVEKFMKFLIQDMELIYTVLDNKKPMTELTSDEENEFKNATFCHICKQLLLDDRVRDHDSITSKFRGAAHAQCNIKYSLCPFVPVIIHNLCGYDSHIFVQELSKYPGEINIIPKTKEKYISITKFIPNKRNNFKQSIQIKFIDSFQFLSTSLDNLSKNLNPNEFVYLTKEFQNKEQLALIKEKGIYPYDYMDSWSKYNETNLPSKKSFFNSLKLAHISDEEYIRAQNIWNKFDIHSLGEFTDLYLKTDVLLLCDVFENFRNTSLKYYQLDPAYYVSSPGLSWDAMLLYTKVRLELIQDLEIHEFLEKGIRGGLAQCSHRHAVANNKYLPFFDESKQSEFLIYLDCNNLYGHAMMKQFPISDFKFLSQHEIDGFNVSYCTEQDDMGYILEVDLSYPEHLHEAHSDLPFAPEKFVPPGGKTPKLISNLYDKYNYVIHYMHLKECLKQGLELKKIHRIISFRQHDYLKSYIELNTKLRQQASSAFQKDFFKLLNNAIFGKTIQNKRKQVDVKLVTSWADHFNKTNKYLGAEKLIAKPNFKSIAIFSDDFVAIQLRPEKIILDRPIYIGFTVLEYAKKHLYQFHYNFIKQKYGKNAKLCYTDTDSLLYSIKTDDFYKDMRNSINFFDTSNYSPENPYGIPQVNAKVPGLFKDELGGDVICEFVGLRAKLYCIESVSMQISKAKGASKSIMKHLTISKYRDTLCNNTNVKFNMNRIKSIRHILYSQHVNKLVLNGNDDKRQLINKVETLPWGHCDAIL